MTSRASIDRAEQAVRAAGGAFRQSGGDTFRATGLCHDAKSADSLIFFYHPDEGRLKPFCHADCDYETILAALGLAKRDLYDESRGTGSGPGVDCPPRAPKPEPVIFDPAPLGWRPPVDTYMPKSCGHQKSEEYLRTDERGAILYGVARCPEKCLRHWRPVPSWPHRRWSLDALDQNHDVIARTRRVPYRLPYIIRAAQDEQVIWLCEGEKDALTALRTFGCASTSSKNWRPDFNRFFEGTDVRIVADRDPAGERIAKGVVEQLLPVVRSLEVVQSHYGKDLTNHVEAGGHEGNLVTVWEPKPFPIGVS